MARRFVFWGAVVTRGLRWARTVLDNTLLALGVLVLALGVGASGVLVGQPGWFVGGLLVAATSVVLGEGAYRAWDDADDRATKATRQLVAEHSREAVSARLDGYAREWELLRQEIPPDGPVITIKQQAWHASGLHLSERVRSELRNNAPGFMDYWMTNPDSLPPEFPMGPYAKALTDLSIRQLHHISSRVKQGHDSP